MIKTGPMPVPRSCLLAVALIATLGCRKEADALHGSPVLVEVFWEVKGIRTRIWSRDADPAVPTTVPPEGSRVDFVFDRRLDGERIEDTVNDQPVPKANPPITVSWPDMDTVMSVPPFAADVLYNSLPDFGDRTTYTFFKPRVPGFPAMTTITFALDPNGLTSLYGEPMDGPPTITIDTGPFTVTLPPGSFTAPTNYQIPIAFSTRAPKAETLMPFVHVLDGVTPLPFTLLNDQGDSKLVYAAPTGCRGGWPPGAAIVIFADVGLPDAFGRPLAVPVTGRFTASRIASPEVDGGCGPSDAGTSDADTTDATTDAATDAANDGGTTDAATTDGGVSDAGPDAEPTDGGTSDGEPTDGANDI